jgi:hypothetical protein
MPSNHRYPFTSNSTKEYGLSIEQQNEEYLIGLSNPDREERARSILDLIDLGTFDLDLATWLASRAALGESWITGSGPGGIGKTTTMRAMMSFVPPDHKFVLALPDEIGTIPAEPTHCVMSNELSDHRPPTYLWDQDLRDFCVQKERGHQLVGNVHADNLEEIRAQFVGECGVPESQFRAINVLVFITLEGGVPEGERRIKDTVTKRVVTKIYYSDGSSDHVSVFDPEKGLLESAPHDAETEKRCRVFLEEMLKTEERSLEGVRKAWLA